MNYQKITPELVRRFSKIVGSHNSFIDEETLEKYSHDETEDLRYPPEVVLRPESASQISDILKVCNEQLIPVTPVGGRTGLSGGSLPVFGGVALSTERLDKILEIDERNLQVTTEPGVITQVLQEAVIEKGMVLMAEDRDGKLVFVQPQVDLSTGSGVS